MRPNCYNRPPYADGTWVRTGRFAFRLSRLGFPVCKDVYRYRLSPFFNGCTERLPVGDTPGVAITEGWRCDGCRWAIDLESGHAD